MIDMVISEKSTGLRLAPSQHNDSCRTVKEKSKSSRKSTSSSRHQQRESVHLTDHIENKGGRLTHSGGVLSSQYDDYQKDEEQEWRRRCLKSYDGSCKEEMMGFCSRFNPCTEYKESDI